MAEQAGLEDPAQKLYKEKNASLDLKREVDKFATWSFGIAVVFFWMGFGLWFIMPFLFFIPIIAIVLGFVGLSRIKKNENLKGRGWAIAGIIIGFFELAGIALMTLIFILSIIGQAA